MDVIDNINTTLRDDLKNTIRKGSKVSIASAFFSIYAFQELKSELRNIESFRFLFTSPTFDTEHGEKEKREFYIPALQRERSVYGTEFEVRLRNELSQKAIARECADWIRKKAEFRTNITNDYINRFIAVSNGDEDYSYGPIEGFTTTGLGCQRGNCMSNIVVKMDSSKSKYFSDLFDSLWNNTSCMKDVKEEILDRISAAYVENPPDFIYFFTLYNIFSEFLEDISDDRLPNEGVGYRESKIWQMLYPFQRDAVVGIINKMETFNGCILADSVGLGKTYTALAVIKYYECRSKNVLVLCPKKLSDNWNTFKNNYRNNPVAEDRMRYDVLFHTDLSRKKGMSNGLDLKQIVWKNYDLVVIDESHNFRNGGDVDNPDSQSRYARLINEVIRQGVKTKVLMLSATPVNNRFYDLRNQLEVAYEGDPVLMNSNLRISGSLDDVFRNAQREFTEWSKLPPEERATETLLKRLDFDFFEVLDSVTIARSRRHIEKYYDLGDIGSFPRRLPPISKRPGITDLKDVVSYAEINAMIEKLNLAVYVPTDFLHPSRVGKYIASGTINRHGREQGIRRLMSISLLKRLESSIHSFLITVNKVLYRIEKTMSIIDRFDGKTVSIDSMNIADDEFDDETFSEESLELGKNFKIDLNDMDYTRWRNYLSRDAEMLRNIASEATKITPEHDGKLNVLNDIILDKVLNPINEGNRKILIFSAFSDTAKYLYDNLIERLHDRYGLNVGLVTGDSVKSTVPKLTADFNDVLTCFSPVSKNADLLIPDIDERIDILIGTDCISEGQNLQDCDCCINYDIHWNPVRIIQRFGRIDRIGSRNEVIQLVNLWPDVDLDEYIRLKERVEMRMKISVLSSTGDDDPINTDEHGDLRYRAEQLRRLQDEVVDIEEMQSGVSILDLGLNEFRLDLVDYVKTHGDLDRSPFGLHAVVRSSDDMPPGCMFVLKNINDNVNIDKQNRLHPFYMVYVGDDGSIICDHLSPRKLLDIMRFSCRGRMEPDMELCDSFNKETRDGKDMKATSELLETAIESIIEVKEQSDLDLFLSGGDVSFNDKVRIKGLDDFELICFLVIR